MNKDVFSKAVPNEQESPYDAVLSFARTHQGISYTHFDAALVRNLNLFALAEQLNFEELKENLEHIIEFLPSIKRILSRPIIRLKDSEEILPVEAVRLINNRTIVHSSVHSELWENMGDGALRPKKLMTLQHQDHYAIYENIVVARAIDIILAYVNRNMKALFDLLYTDRNMQVNLFERANHLSYFLAIGKLHIGYVRDYDKYRADAEECLEKLFLINRVLRPRLNSIFYKRCSRFKKEVILQRTNIFRNQKDYHRIYLLMRWFEKKELDRIHIDSANESALSLDAYGVFCGMICLFAAGHFNFLFDEGQGIDFERLSQDAEFLSWSLHISNVDVDGEKAILLDLSKDISYRVLLLPTVDAAKSKEKLLQIKEEISCQEYFLLTPDTQIGALYMSLFDMESFRKIQQILLRAMICSDTQRRECPFCGNTLSKGMAESNDFYECSVCRTQIIHNFCSKHQKSFVSTNIKNFVPDKNVFERHGEVLDKLFNERLVKGLLHYRNITDIDQNGNILCPYCNIKHF